MTPDGMARAVFEDVWNRRDFAKVDSILADRFRFHIGGSSRTMTIADLSGIIDAWHLGFRDFRFEVHTVVASGNRAAVHATLNGTHDGRWDGLEPTGRTISVEHMFFFRIEEGLIVEVWELLDRSELRRQLTGS